MCTTVGPQEGRVDLKREGGTSRGKVGPQEGRWDLTRLAKRGETRHAVPHSLRTMHYALPTRTMHYTLRTAHSHFSLTW
jgi:hypothetical protein